MIRSFWQAFVGSFGSAHFYVKLRSRSFGYSLKFLLGLFFLVGVALATIVTWTSYQLLGNNPRLIYEELGQVFPEELRITFDEGRIQTNVDEPYAISWSELESAPTLTNVFEFIGADSDSEMPANLLVIDTQGSINNFYDYDTWALMTDRTFSIMSDEHKVETILFDEFNLDETDDDFGALVLDKNKFNLLLDEMGPIFNFLFTVMYPSLFIFSLLGFVIAFLIVSLVSLLWYSLATWLASRLASWSLTYGQSYRYTIHLGLPVFVVLIVLGILGWSEGFFLRNTLLFLIVAWIVLTQAKKIAEPEADDKAGTKGVKKD